MKQSDDKSGLASMNIKLAEKDANGSDGSESNEVSEDASILKQTRVRRVFTETQLFAFNASYMTTWLGVGCSMYYAFLNGGPVAYIFNYIIVLVGVLAQAASLAELASIQPVAGAQYYWTYRFSPPSSRRFLTYMQGWVTWTGYIAGLASLLNSNVVIIEGVIGIQYPSFEVTGWKTFLIIAAVLLFCYVVNVWFFQLVPWFEVLAGIVNVVFFFVFLVTIWLLAPRNPASFLMTKSVYSGWDNYFISWNIGVLSQVWLFIGFEAIVHMSDETKNAKTAVPRGMFWSVLVNGLTGLVTIFMFTICMPPNIEDIMNATSPLVTIVQYATGSDRIATVLMAGDLIMGVSCALASFSSTARLTWAWARDGGLPKYFAHVDGTHRVPTRAVTLTALLVLFLALLNLGSETYTALGAITSLAVIGSYMSYAIILVLVIYIRSTAGLELGPWNMGRFGLLVNVFALLYTCWTLVFLPFPSVLPVTASNMNWSLPAFVTVMAIALTLWYSSAKKNWPGPNQKVVDYVLKQES